MTKKKPVPRQELAAQKLAKSRVIYADFSQLATKHGQTELEYAMRRYLEGNRAERKLSMDIRIAERNLEELRRKR